MAAPLAMPPTMKPGRWTTTSLATVSVVMMARAASWPPLGWRPAASEGTPAATMSMGSGMPINPVEHTSTASGSQPMAAAVSAHMRAAWATPSAPVAALALPLLSTTAAACPPVAARWARVTCTGAAASLFWVKVAAALTGRPSAVATSDRSGSPEGLMPAATPLATNPAGVVTLTGTPPPRRGRRSRAVRAPRWRTAPPVPTHPSPGCRWRRSRRPSASADRLGR